MWLSVDGEVATAETRFTQSKHERGLLVTGAPDQNQEERYQHDRASPGGAGAQPAHAAR